jgi:flavin-dependent dehydrogenase
MRNPWDAIVVGAGPAGAIASRELARMDFRVLLVDKAVFPRQKVCGCCMNGAAIETLERLGLDHVLADATPLHRVRIGAGTRSAPVGLPRSVALSREAFDSRLVAEAVKAGVEFRPATLAKLGEVNADAREVHLNGEAAFARVVILASGLAGRDSIPERGSRIGAGVMVPGESAPSYYVSGTIYMATGRHGYVGLVRVEDERLDIAAAFDPSYAKVKGGVGPSSEAILQEVKWPVPQCLADLPWKGTPALTRSPVRVAEQRLFAAGDAAGYIEPFTGEGMAWAAISAMVLAPIAGRAIGEWNNGLAREWEAVHRRVLGRRQRICRMVAHVLRSPLLCRFAVHSIAAFPALARPIVNVLNEPPPQHRSLAYEL